MAGEGGMTLHCAGCGKPGEPPRILYDRSGKLPRFLRPRFGWYDDGPALLCDACQKILNRRNYPKKTGRRRRKKDGSTLNQTGTLMKLTDIYPSKYLKAADLQGKETIAKILEVREEEIGMDKEHKPILYFHGSNKGLVLNKTNALMIGDHYGDDTDDWQGKPVILYSAWVDFQGRSTQAIRVRVPTEEQPAVKMQAPSGKKKKGAAQILDDLDDEIPF
jgi:hypothetical protein